MMTPQEVATSTFPKATLGGYNMAAVDVFLDKLTDDYTELYQENAALKAKMKVLVDKMEEYHSMEDTMRSTLLTAQKMANNMIKEAEEKRAFILEETEKKRAQLLDEAEADARVRMRELAADVAAEERRLAAVHEDIDRQIALEQGRLVVAQRELAAFINGAKALCSKQLDLIARLSELDVLPAGVRMDEESEPMPELESLGEDHDIPEVQESEEVKEEEVKTEEPAEPSEDAPEAQAQAVEELGGDANALMESMRSVIDSFGGEGSVNETEVAEGPFEIGFDDANKLFGSGEDGEVPDPFENEEEEYDNFDGEETDATRVLNLNDLQFGRNYNKGRSD